MADFDTCYEKTLDSIPNDRGGWTYAGISRRFHPDWIGWEIIDIGQTPAPETVQDFYDIEFWRPLRGDEIMDNSVVWPVYDFSVTSGLRIAVRAAQVVLGVVNDGILGPRTLAALNSVDPHQFQIEYAFFRIRFYLDIARRDRSQRGHLLSWIGRAVAGV